MKTQVPECQYVKSVPGEARSTLAAVWKVADRNTLYLTSGERGWVLEHTQGWFSVVQHVECNKYQSTWEPHSSNWHKVKWCK